MAVVLHRREKTRCETNWTSKTSWPKLFLSVTRCACNLVGILHSTSISSQRIQPRGAHTVLGTCDGPIQCRCESCAGSAQARKPPHAGACAQLRSWLMSGCRAVVLQTRTALVIKPRPRRQLRQWNRRRALFDGLSSAPAPALRLFLHTSPHASCNTIAHPTLSVCWWCLGSTLSVCCWHVRPMW